MLDTVLGLPVHVLVIHAVVVLVPLAALGGLALAARPALHPRLAISTVATTVVGALSAVVAASSGETLEHRLERAGTSNPLLHEHTEAGDLARIVVLVFASVALVAIFWALRPDREGATQRRTAPPLVRTVLRVALAVLSVAALVAVVRAGHTGAQVAWQDLIEQTASLPGH